MLKLYQRYEVCILKFVFCVIVFLATFLAATYPRLASGQVPKTQTFELNKAIVENSITICFDKEAAVAIMDAFSAFGDADDEDKQEVAAEVAGLTIRTYLTLGVCGKVSSVVTYRLLVKEYKAKDGAYLTVYEADVEGLSVKAFIPLVGWRHHRMET